MDNVKLSFQVPQEDELAINVLSSGTSYYMPLVFMKQEPEFRDFVSFKTATSKDRGRWCNAFTHFLKKLTVRTGDKRLLLKSPVHTGRVELLLQLFPKAQFVYIHRDPYTVRAEDRLSMGIAMFVYGRVCGICIQCFLIRRSTVAMCTYGQRVVFGRRAF